LYLQAAERERRMLGLQSDFAMLFSTVPNHFTFWLGKVQRLIRVFQRKRVDLREPVDLDAYDGDIYVVAHWYKLCQEVNGADVHSVYQFNTPDLNCYHIKHVVAPLQLTTRIVSAEGAPRMFEYDLCAVDKEAIDRAIADVTGAGSTTSGRTASGRAAQQMADDGLTHTAVRSERTGRMRSQRQYSHK
jgi:hypothetical protein